MDDSNKNKIKELVINNGLIYVLNLFGDNKDIIRQVYIDNPESYLDYLIDDLIPMDSSGYVKKAWTYNFKKNIFIVYESDESFVSVDDFIWNYFYKGIMQFDNNKIESIFTKWFFKHIPELSEKKPIAYSDLDDIQRKWEGSGLLKNQKVLRSSSDYMVVGKSVADYLKHISQIKNL